MRCRRSVTERSGSTSSEGLSSATPEASGGWSRPTRAARPAGAAGAPSGLGAQPRTTGISDPDAVTTGVTAQTPVRPCLLATRDVDGAGGVPERRSRRPARPPPTPGTARRGRAPRRAVRRAAGSPTRRCPRGAGATRRTATGRGAAWRPRPPASADGPASSAERAGPVTRGQGYAGGQQTPIGRRPRHTSAAARGGRGTSYPIRPPDGHRPRGSSGPDRVPDTGQTT